MSKSQEPYEEMLVEFSDTDGEYEPMEKKEVVLESSSDSLHVKGKKYTVSEKAKKAKADNLAKGRAILAEKRKKGKGKAPAPKVQPKQEQSYTYDDSDSYSDSDDDYEEPRKARGRAKEKPVSLRKEPKMSKSEMKMLAKINKQKELINDMQEAKNKSRAKPKRSRTVNKTVIVQPPASIQYAPPYPNMFQNNGIGAGIQQNPSTVDPNVSNYKKQIMSDIF